MGFFFGSGGARRGARVHEPRLQALLTLLLHGQLRQEDLAHASGDLAELLLRLLQLGIRGTLLFLVTRFYRGRFSGKR